MSMTRRITKSPAAVTGFGGSPPPARQNNTFLDLPALVHEKIGSLLAPWDRGQLAVTSRQMFAQHAKPEAVGRAAYACRVSESNVARQTQVVKEARSSARWFTMLHNDRHSIVFGHAREALSFYRNDRASGRGAGASGACLGASIFLDTVLYPVAVATQLAINRSEKPEPQKFLEEQQHVLCRQKTLLASHQKRHTILDGIGQ